MQTAPAKLLVTIGEAAQALSLCEKSVWSHTFPRGSLRATRVGKSVRYSIRELERSIEEQSAKK